MYNSIKCNRFIQQGTIEIMNNSPKITVVTPCFNMGRHIEKTIQSVLSQNYANLEYIVVDGGSTDNTMEIVERYRDRLAKIFHEPDHGMYDAIRKGFAAGTGEILCWLNADDQSMPWTLHTVGEIFGNYPKVKWLTGMPAFMNEKRQLTKIYTMPAAVPRKYIRNGWCRSDVRGLLQQENMFWRRELYDQAGGINTEWKLAEDFELWTRFAKYAELTTANIPFSAFMKRNDSLSRGSDKYYDELMRILADRKKYPSCLWRLGAKCAPLKALLRLLIRYKTPIVYYSEREKKFVLKKIRRPVSGNSLSEIAGSILMK